MSDKLRILIVGLGNRGFGCFAKGIMGLEGKGDPRAKDVAEIVGFVDTNTKRAEITRDDVGLDIPVFANIFDATKNVEADWAVVTTVDRTHKEVVCQCLESGVNVLVDKPLATSAWECDAIIETAERTGKRVVVGHNMRYQKTSYNAAKLIRSGAIGDVLSVEVGEILDNSHGGDYFHRWHSDFECSAGMLSHKGCHLFDVVNWILDDVPVAVSATGSRQFYTPREDLDHAERCSECGIASDCPHFFDADKWDGIHRKMYYNAEDFDGYIRDKCVFSDRHTIDDTEIVNVRYKKGTSMTFTLVTYAPKEYVYFFFTGTKGRIEFGRDPKTDTRYLRHYKTDGTFDEIDIASESTEHEHGHGDADMALIADMIGLSGNKKDPMLEATPEEARRAVLIADLASRSKLAGGKFIDASEAGNDFPPAPNSK